MSEAGVRQPVVELQRQPREWQRALCRLLRNPVTVFGLVLVLLALACAIFAPLIAPYDPILGNLRDHLQLPSALHIYGTDNFGRDILSRTIYGSQISLKITLAVQVLTLIVSYAQIARFQGDFRWAVVALALAALLTFTASRAVADAARQRAGIHAAGAVAALALGCAMMLHDQHVLAARYIPFGGEETVAGDIGVSRPINRNTQASVRPIGVSLHANIE